MKINLTKKEAKALILAINYFECALDDSTGFDDLDIRNEKAFDALQKIYAVASEIAEA